MVEKLIFVAVVDGGLESCICVAFHTRLSELAGRLIAQIEQTQKSLIVASWLYLGCAVDISMYCRLPSSCKGSYMVLDRR